MATLTKNYNLTKPDGSDKAQISVLNADFDQIDAQMKVNADAAAKAKEAADAKQDPITVDKEITADSNNPISSAAVSAMKTTLEQADTDENSRATQAEQQIRQAVTDESNRAGQAESTNAKAISAVSDAIGTESTRAKNAESSITNDLTSKLNAETLARQTATSVRKVIESDGYLYNEYFDVK